MQTNPLVSVLTTSFNREKYLAAAIESVLAQTFDNFELLIVDDHSSDASVEIAEAYARRDPRIRVVVNDSNLGQFAARNRAAQLARGQFLKYHDSDDLMYPHALVTMLCPLMAEARAGFALSGGTSWAGGACPMLLTPRLCYQREFLGTGMFMNGPSAALFRAAVFHELGGFPQRGVGSDYLFWLAACARVSVLLVPADLSWYRLHEGQELHRPVAAWEYAIVPGAAWRALAAPDCPLISSEIEQARRNLVASILKLTYRDLRSGRRAVARYRLQQLDLSVTEWLRYARPPRRDPLAGTPRDAAGEFLTPDWSHFRLPGSLRSENRP